MTLEDTILSDFTEKFVMMDETTTVDSYGSIVPVWQEGAEFKAALTAPQSGTAEIAEAIKEKKSFNVVTETNITLKQGKFFKRVSDGTVFKVLRDNTDKLTPNNSAIPMRATEAEITELPKE
jgi:hypothetical protein